MADKLKVEVVRSGGFAGLTTSGALESSVLDATAAAELADNVAAAGLDPASPTEAAAPTEPKAPPPAGSRRARAGAGGMGGPATGGADRFQYDITVQRGSKKRKLTVSEAELTPPQRALIDRVLGG